MTPAGRIVAALDRRGSRALPDRLISPASCPGKAFVRVESRITSIPLTSPSPTIDTGGGGCWIWGYLRFRPAEEGRPQYTTRLGSGW